MQRRQVLVRKVFLDIEVALLDPRVHIVGGPHADPIPRASDDVVHAEHEEGALSHTDENVEVLRVDVVHQCLDQLLQLHQPQQAQRTHNSYDAKGLPHACHRGSPALVAEPGDEVRGDHEQVEGEPGLYVVQGDAAGPQLLCALQVESSHEGENHVAEPKRQSHPEDGVSEPCCGGLESQLHWNRQEVVPDENYAAYVPSQPLRGAWPEYPGPQRRRLRILHRRRLALGTPKVLKSSGEFVGPRPVHPEDPVLLALGVGVELRLQSLCDREGLGSEAIRRVQR
mmetsp:Transcript_135259/g.350469  ORF Transcript_135259/g.350469 Transcript_135259/m.350469 type:complete len:283 (-) Transcript_135259:413-1261(-)